MPLKAIALAVALLAGQAHAGGWGALGGVGESLQRQAEMDAQLEAQKRLIELQHRHEMERMRYQYEMERQRQQAAPAVPAPSIPADEMERRRREVDALHPGWRILVQSPSYQNWVNNLAPEMRRRALSSEVSEFSHALGVYKREMKLD